MNREGNTTLFRSIYDYFLRHWFLSTLIATLPLAYLIVYVTFSVEILDLAKISFPDSLSHRVFIGVMIFSFAFVLAKNLADKYNDVARKNGQLLVLLIQNGIDSAVSFKIRRIEEYLNEYSKGNTTKSLIELLDPKGQVNYMVEVIQHSLSKMFAMPLENIGISIIYKLNDQPWNWFVSKNVEDDLTIDMLVGDSKTTANHIINSNRVSIFFPDKRNAISIGEYLAGELDIKHNYCGSIYCKSISFNHLKDSFVAVLSITTFGFQICEESDEESKYKFEKILMPPFEMRIKLEFANFIISNLFKK